MLEVADARGVVLRACQPLGAAPTPLADALGRVLAEDVRADLDSPPFTKALMDGYAVRAADCGRACGSPPSSRRAPPGDERSGRARRSASSPAHRCPTGPTPS